MGQGTTRHSTTGVTTGVATEDVLLSTDFGEELDDLFAFLHIVRDERGASNIHWHCIVSAGEMDPAARLTHLSNLLGTPDSPVQFGPQRPEWPCTFYADGDIASLRALPEAATAFVNNGPLSPVSLEHVARVLSPTAVLYLPGASLETRSGGVNQNFWDASWAEFMEHVEDPRKQRQIVCIPPSVSRCVRFPTAHVCQRNGAEAAQAAALGQATALQFMASRPDMPARLGGITTIIRLNSANRDLCLAWRKEAAIAYTAEAHSSALVKARAYVDMLEARFATTGGKGDSVASVEAQLREAFKDDDLLWDPPTSAEGSLVKLTPVTWEAVRRLVLPCFELTYDVARLCGIEEPYAEGKYGYPPKSKQDANPGGVFADDECAGTIGAKLIECLRDCTLTPAYDVLTVAMCENKWRTQPCLGDVAGLKHLAFGGE